MTKIHCNLYIQHRAEFPRKCMIDVMQVCPVLHISMQAKYRLKWVGLLAVRGRDQKARCGCRASFARTNMDGHDHELKDALLTDYKSIPEAILSEEAVTSADVDDPADTTVIWENVRTRASSIATDSNRTTSEATSSRTSNGDLRVIKVYGGEEVESFKYKVWRYARIVGLLVVTFFVWSLLILPVVIYFIPNHSVSADHPELLHSEFM